MGIKWEVRPENGVNIYWLVIKHVEGVESAYPEGEFREGTPYFNRMLTGFFFLM